MTDEEHHDVVAVSALVTELTRRLNEAEQPINQAHVHNASSGAIQAVVSRILKEHLAFSEEVVLTPQDGLVTHPRPDFFFGLGPGRGVIAEVERGGTLTNNHDLKNMWKAHIAPDVQHLILIVPVSNWKAGGRAREKPFLRVQHRIAAFFGDQRREVDVVSCHVIGYGTDTLGGEAHP